MKNTAVERLEAMLLVAASQFCIAAYEPDAVAAPAPGDVVVPVEVEEKLRANRWREPGAFGADWRVPAPLSQPADYPSLRVNIEPADAKDFAVTINGTRYQAGARAFRVLLGTATIVVTRGDKESCKAKLEVSASGPNAIACRL